MVIEKARLFHGLCIIECASVLKWNNGSYIIEFQGNLGNSISYLQTTRKKIRYFKTIDSAANCLFEIGIKQFNVKI